MQFDEIVSFTVNVFYTHCVEEKYESGTTKIIIRMSYHPFANNPDSIRKRIKLEIEKYLWKKNLIGVKDVTYSIISPILKISSLDSILYNQSNYDLDITMEKPQPTRSTSSLTSLSSLSSITSDVPSLLKSVAKSVIVTDNKKDKNDKSDKYETLSEAGTFVEAYKPQTQFINRTFDLRLK